MRNFCLALFAFCAILIASPSAQAYSRGGNRPYVQSMEGGAFYAKCVPDEKEGSKGETKIYRVGKEQDELVDTYNWYSREGVVLAWSPIAGKVAVMALREEAEDRKQVEFSFYLGGRLLHSYTLEDLAKMGVQIRPFYDWNGKGKERGYWRVLGYEQVNNSNDYVFAVEVNGEKRLGFDILTGEPRK